MMTMTINVLVGLVALLHLYFMVLEMFFWDKPLGLKVFGLTPEDAAVSKVLAANQGLYNGFLSAGLIWGLVTAQTDIKVFFLACVVVAGLYGAISTGNKRILVVQMVPALLALVLLFL